jgi:hypothetical protein
MELTLLDRGHFFTEPFLSTRKKGELNSYPQSTLTSSRFSPAACRVELKSSPEKSKC